MYSHSRTNLLMSLLAHFVVVPTSMPHDLAGNWINSETDIYTEIAKIKIICAPTQYMISSSHFILFCLFILCFNLFVLFFLVCFKIIFQFFNFIFFICKDILVYFVYFYRVWPWKIFTIFWSRIFKACLSINSIFSWFFFLKNFQNFKYKKKVVFTFFHSKVLTKIQK